MRGTVGLGIGVRATVVCGTEIWRGPDVFGVGEVDGGGGSVNGASRSLELVGGRQCGFIRFIRTVVRKVSMVSITGSRRLPAFTASAMTMLRFM